MRIKINFLSSNESSNRTPGIPQKGNLKRISNHIFKAKKESFWLGLEYKDFQIAKISYVQMQCIISLFSFIQFYKIF